MDALLRQVLDRRQALKIGSKIMIVSAAVMGTGGTLLAKENKDFWGGFFRSESKPGQAEIIYANGRVFANGKPAKVGQKIPFLTTIRVPKRTVVRLRFPDESVVEVRGDAKFVVEIQKSSGGFLQLLWGAILAVVPQDKVNPYVIKGPTAVVGIKGTVFYMEVFPPGQTTSSFGNGTVEHPPGFKEYFCLCHGDADFIQPDSFQIAKTEEKVYHHKAYFMNFSEETPKLEPGGMLNHTDLEIYELIKNQRKHKHSTDWLETGSSSY